MADDPKVTKNLLDMYGRNDWMMRVNFRFFLSLSGLGRISRESRILDCGCGMGHLLLTLKMFGFDNLVGLDASEEMVAAARQLTGAPIILSDVLELESHVEPASMDAVIISDLVHHIPSTDGWDRLLSGSHKCLREGGLLIIREPYPTLSLRLLYALSRFRFLHVGFLRARLRSFIEEDHLLKYFFGNWLSGYKELLPRHGFNIERDRSWLVHRITTCRKKGGVA